MGNNERGEVVSTPISLVQELDRLEREEASILSVREVLANNGEDVSGVDRQLEAIANDRTRIERVIDAYEEEQRLQAAREVADNG